MSEAPAAPPLRADRRQRPRARSSPSSSRTPRGRRLPERGRARSGVHRAAPGAGVRVPADHERGRAGRQPARPARGAERDRVHRRRVGAVLHRDDRGRQRRHRREDGADPGGPRPGPQARRRHDQEHLPDRQAEHPQQPAAGHQPVRGRAGARAREPLRRHDPGQRPADGARRAQAPRRGHPRGVQPDQPLPARQLLGRLRPVRVRPALRDQQRHADEVLLATRPATRTSPSRSAASAAGSRRRTASSSRAGGPTRSNKPIADLTGFTKTFFAKHTLLNILTKYCVFDVDRKLLVMRPYQIVATERILQRIETSTNYKTARHDRRRRLRLAHHRLGQDADELQGRPAREQAAERRQGAVRRRPQGPRLPDHAGVRPLREGRGQLEHLDRACSSGSSRTRTRGSSSPRSRSSPASSRQNKGHAIYDGHVVVIFDECHRSQFGDMHTAITQGVQALPPVRLHRHADLRRERRHRRQPAAAHHRAGVRRQAAHLHDRRRDQRQERAAVPHRLRQHDQDARRTSTDKQVVGDRHRASAARARADRRRSSATSSSTSTRRPSAARPTASGSKRVAGFNSLFATASIDAAKRYYTEFAQQQQREDAARGYQRLKVGLIYSYAANEDDRRRVLGEEEFETERARRELARLPRRRDPGLQRHVRHELRHLGRQVPELLQGPVAAAEEPRARPRRSSSTCS